MPVMTQKMCHGAWFQPIWTQNVFCDVVEMTPDGGHLHDAVELVAYFTTALIPTQNPRGLTGAQGKCRWHHLAPSAHDKGSLGLLFDTNHRPVQPFLPILWTEEVGVL